MIKFSVKFFSIVLWDFQFDWLFELGSRCTMDVLLDFLTISEKYLALLKTSWKFVFGRKFSYSSNRTMLPRDPARDVDRIFYKGLEVFLFEFLISSTPGYEVLTTLDYSYQLLKSGITFLTSGDSTEFSHSQILEPSLKSNKFFTSKQQQ